MTETELPVRKLSGPIPVGGGYARRVLEHGHEPGVLSGCELRGRARQYSGWYLDVRRRVERFAAEHGISARLVRDPRSNRLVRVWTDAETGQPVRVVIND